MPDPVLGHKEPEPAILERIGKIATEWGWVEMLLAEMLAHFCAADPGSMYVITQNVSPASQIDWLRTLTQMKVHDATSQKVILDLLNQIDDARSERNGVVHATWRAHDNSGFAWASTFRWERQEVVRDQLWSLADLDDVIEDIRRMQLMLSNLGIKIGFLKLEKGVTGAV